MLEIVSWFVIAFVTYVIDCFVFCKIMGQKRFYFDYKTIGLIIIASIINCYFKNNYTVEISSIVTNLELAILLKILYDKSFVKTLISTLFIFLGYAICEAIVVMFVTLILGHDVSVFQTFSGAIISNIVIMVIFVLIMSWNVITKFIKYIVDFYKDNELVNTIFLILVAFATFYALTYPICIRAYSKETTIIYILFFICTAIFVSGFFKQKSKNNELSVEYDYLLEYVKVYEKELDERIKRQHEYKNQLVILKDMVDGKDKKVLAYINDILDEEYDEQDEAVLNSLQYFPSGGLKGLVYYKLVKLKEQNGEIHINVSHELHEEKIWDTCLDELKDVSKVVGIFLDNAIEALKDEEEKFFILDVDYDDGSIELSFSNTCTKDVDFSKMDLQGYSTKGRGHGYGLSLVHDIVEANSLLHTAKEINGKFFVQHLFVKVKKD